MRVRKKPDLRLNIPSYPHDYVEMPPRTRRRILESCGSPNDVPDQEDKSFQVNLDINRSVTPEIKIFSPEDDTIDIREENSATNEIGDEKNVEGKSTVDIKRDNVSNIVEFHWLCSEIA
ncbi:unnamed protein product [Danaus chrysippus]|uniref:(African queen) hypothetical protein n=1 Tax=Danaus chrysippus TaxID=151541 RepID=A0A8J2QU47_9NEOP|nr:unnamed protein product [Danaus chrysippus]